MIYVQGIFEGVEIGPDGKTVSSRTLVLTDGEYQAVVSVDQEGFTAVREMFGVGTATPAPSNPDEPAPFVSEEQMEQVTLDPAYDEGREIQSDYPSEATQWGGDLADFDQPPPAELQEDDFDPGEVPPHPLMVDDQEGGPPAL